MGLQIFSWFGDFEYLFSKEPYRIWELFLPHLKMLFFVKKLKSKFELGLEITHYKIQNNVYMF